MRTKVLLKDILEEKGYIRGPFGSALRRSEMLESGIPVYEQQNAIYDNREFRYFISEDKYGEMKRFKVEPGDIIISCSGTVGKTTLIKENDPIGIISQALLCLRVDKAKVRPEYLQYFFKTNIGFKSLLECSHGSVQNNIAKREVVESIKLDLPDVYEQDVILSILISIDDKIKLNLRINDYLTQQKQLAFKILIDSIDDTNVVKLESVATLQKKTWKPSDTSEILEHYSIPAFDEKKYPSFDESTTIQSNKTIVTSDCILVSKLNPETKRVWRPICMTDKAVCSTEFLAIIPKDKKYAQYIFGQIDSDGFTEYLINNATGSTGSRQRVLPGTAMLYELPWPEQFEIESYSDLAQSIDSKIRSNMLENEKLIELRKYLLPKLMSGEIDVSKLELNS